MKLPTDSTERKNTPIYSGCIAYFPLALAAVARLSKRGNDKHNPGEPLHWAREKSTDHKDCIARHLVDIDVYDEELQEYDEAAAVAWRALAYLQILEEFRLGKATSDQVADCAAVLNATLQVAAAVSAKKCGLSNPRNCLACQGSGTEGAGVDRIWCHVCDGNGCM